MKTIILSFFSILFSTGIYAQYGVIASPETTVLYRGYANKLVPLISSNETAMITIDGGSCSPSNFSIDGIQYKGYLIKPNPEINFVNITLSGKSKNGTVQNYGKFKYKVIDFPNAHVLTTVISKSMGCRLTVGITDSPVTASFTVIGGTIFIENETFSFDGSIIPASILEKAKLKTGVIINVNYSRVGDEENANTIKAILEVIE